MTLDDDMPPPPDGQRWCGCGDSFIPNTYGATADDCATCAYLDELRETERRRRQRLQTWGQPVVNDKGKTAVVRGWDRIGVTLWLEFPTAVSPQREVAADWEPIEGNEP